MISSILLKTVNIKLKLNPFTSVLTYWSQCLSLVSVMLSGWESLSPPGRDTDPSQVSCYSLFQPRKDGKLGQLWWKEDHTNIHHLAELPCVIKLKHQQMCSFFIERGLRGEEFRNIAICLFKLG